MIKDFRDELYPAPLSWTGRRISISVSFQKAATLPPGNSPTSFSRDPRGIPIAAPNESGQILILTFLCMCFQCAIMRTAGPHFGNGQ